MLQRWLGVVLLLVATAVSADAQPVGNVLVESVSASAPAKTASVECVVAPVLAPGESKKNTVSTGSISDEKPVDWFTRTAALIGVLLGLGNVGFAIWKVTRDRRLSVEDDFWFRKIVAPATIEPLLKGVMQLLQDMPVKGSLSNDLSSYARKITTDFQKLYASMQTLGLIDSSWPKMVIDKLQACEDALTEHVGEIIDNDPKQEPGSIELQNSVLRMLNDALHVIKVSHLKK